MKDLYHRIEGLCQLEGINMSQMCRLAGVSRGALSDLKAGRKTGLSAATLTKVAGFFGVSADYLLGVLPEGAVIKGSGEARDVHWLTWYFQSKTGRLPTREELEGLEQYLAIYLKSLSD